METIKELVQRNKIVCLSEILVHSPGNSTVGDVLDELRELCQMGEVVVPYFKFPNGSLHFGFLCYQVWADAYFGTPQLLMELVVQLRLAFACTEEAIRFLGFWNGDVLLI